MNVKTLSLALLAALNATTLGAQSTEKDWRIVADKYLDALMQDNEEYWLFEEELSDQMEKLYSSQEDRLQLPYLLMAWGGTSLMEIDEDTFQQVLNTSYADKPYEKALTLLDYYSWGYKSLNSIKNIRNALTLLETMHKDSSLIYIHALMDLGDLLLNDKNYKEALSNYNRALALTENTVGTNTQIFNDLLSRLARYHLTVGNTELAVQYNDKKEQHASRELGVNLPYATLFNSKVGIIENSDPEITDAYRLALIYHYRWGSVYRKALAVQLYEDAANLIIKKEGLNSVNYASITWNKGSAKLSINHDAAIQDLEQAVGIYQNIIRQANPSVDARKNFYDVLNHLGHAYFTKKKFSNARTVYEELLSMFKGTRLEGGTWYGSALHNLIIAHHQLGNHKQLGNLLKPFIGERNWFKRGSKDEITMYGDLLFRAGEYAAAAEAYTYSYNEYWHLEGVASMSWQRQKQDAANALEGISDLNNILLDIGTSEVVNMIHRYKPVSESYTALLLKAAKASFLAGDYELARKYVLTYINEFYTRTTYVRDRGTDLYDIYRLQEQLFPAYDLYQNILLRDTTASAEVQSESNMRAYGHLLDSKANIQFQFRHMLEVIAGGSDENLKAALQTYNNQRKQIAMLRLSGDTNTTELEALTISIDTLKQYLSTKTSLVSEPQKSFVFWTDVKKSLKKGEAAVEIKRFYLFENGHWGINPVYAAYIITPNSESPDVVFFSNSDLLEGRALKNYQNSMQAKLDDMSSYLSYWQPIQAKLRGAKVVYVSADGVYNQINLNTLFNPATHKYLVDELTVYNVISTKSLLKEERKRSKIARATLMGRPAYFIKDAKFKNTNPFEDEKDLKRSLTRDQVASGYIQDLPGTEIEISNINTTLKKKGVRTDYYLGQDATEELFKKSTADIIHVATHGFWFAENEALPREDAMLNSGLLFAGVKNYYEGNATSNTDDGILTAYEIQGMNLTNTRLVVLSACETGLGKVEVGEGVYGLQRAFRIAGVDNLIMSLWKVDDTATQELFTSFYSTWLSAQENIIPSFRKAQLELKRKYKHPYYWGAFKVIN
ncbi:MAG: CHAT domain-containing protein [Cyclobacteriaceae bacterium]|nr:CHAT domain-containing protein [Cyclobacteriaceae bacterium]